MKNLDHYFEKARKQQEVVRLSEIKNILDSGNQESENRLRNSISQIFRRNTLPLATGGLFSILLAAMVAFFALRANRHSDDSTFIPPTQRRVMHLVKTISNGPDNHNIRITPFATLTNPQTSGIPAHLRYKFELSEEQLNRLGITFDEECIRYAGNAKGRGYVSFFIPRLSTTDFSKVDIRLLIGPTRAGVNEYDFYPWFLTDENGLQGPRYEFGGREPAGKMTNSFFLNAIDELIPIQIDRPGFTKVVFWFSQTPELMNILESAARTSNTTKLTDDRALDKNSRTIQLEIFPTITNGDVQVIANVLSKQKLEISLLNSSGESLQVPVNQVLAEGEHKFSMTLSTLRKGLYFLRIKSDADRVTIHRLFKE